MKTKAQKKESVGQLNKQFPGSKILVFTTFARPGEKGLSVAQMQELKRTLRSLQSEYIVTKKTLVDLALKGLKYDGIDVFSMDGSLGIVAGQEDVYGLAKKIYEFAKKNQALQFFGAFMDGAFLNKEQFIEMAQLPSREALIARLLSMMRYPLSSLAIVLNQVATQKEAAV